MARSVLFASICFSFLLFSCQAKQKEVESPVKEEKVANAKPEPIIVSLPTSVFEELYTEADYMDVIFQELPYSISQENNSSIRQILRHVDNKAPASINNNCPLLAQQVFQRQGKIIAEADIFCDQGCYYYVFKFKGQVYYNAMTQAGIEFYENLKKGNIQQ